MTTKESDTKKRTVTCPTCEEEFQTHPSVDKTYCCSECYYESMRNLDERVCEHCGSSFTTQPSRTEKYCSPECWADVQRNKATLACETCGGSFEVKAAREDTARFCSQECMGKWRSENISGEKHPNSNQREFDCVICGEVDTRAAYYVNTHDKIRCSDCRDKTYRSGGVDPYGSGWHDSKKEAVRERDNRRCQNCGLVEEEHLKKYGKKHSVHHIKKARWFDDDEARNSMENLVTLCISGCHQKWERMSPLRPQTE